MAVWQEKLVGRRELLTMAGAAAVYGTAWMLSAQGVGWRLEDREVGWVRDGFEQQAEYVNRNARKAHVEFSSRISTSDELRDGNRFLTGVVTDPVSGKPLYFEYRAGGRAMLMNYFQGIDKVNPLDDRLLADLARRGLGSLMVGYGGRPLRGGRPLMHMEVHPTWEGLAHNLWALKKFSHQEYRDQALVREALVEKGMIERPDILHMGGVSYGAAQAMQAGVLAEMMDETVDKRIGWAGPYDIAHVRDTGLPADWLATEILSRREMWGSRIEDPWRELVLKSPAVTLGAIPARNGEFVLLAGEKDNIVSPEHTLNLVKSLREKKIRTRVYLLNETYHYPESERDQQIIWDTCHDSPLMNDTEREDLARLQATSKPGVEFIWQLAGI